MPNNPGSRGPPVRRHAVGLAVAGGMLVAFGVLSLRVGALHVDTATFWSAIADDDRGDAGQMVVRELRVPRTIAGTLAGACFAVAGALTQGVTRNPLGAPGILGINADASFAIVMAVFVLGIATPPGYEDLTGELVLVDGTWMIARETFCGFLVSARTPCQ